MKSLLLAILASILFFSCTSGVKIVHIDNIDSVKIHHPTLIKGDRFYISMDGNLTVNTFEVVDTNTHGVFCKGQYLYGSLVMISWKNICEDETYKFIRHAIMEDSCRVYNHLSR